MRSVLLLILSIGLFCSFGTAHADDHGKKKVVFVAGPPSHRSGDHEHNAGCLLLAEHLHVGMPDIEVRVFQNGWPSDPKAFKDADSVVVYCDGQSRHVLLSNEEKVQSLMDDGVGLVCIHYAVEPPKGPKGKTFLNWLGGYFEQDWSVNPHWTANFTKLPEHPITQGVKPFSINDEWYYHMRFREGLEGVTPILSDNPPKETLNRRDGHHSGNPHVREAIANGEIQHVAWATERENGGRSFGFTGGHRHINWKDDNFRTLVLNAIVWSAHGEVPENGVPTDTPSNAAMSANLDPK
ncbi:ThuA domain-containing protein [Calycomorphotria hydatis]|nr:ThuA domain-containing protein [Calycomorphotria hydatis]